jgi:uncharacterized damage-inducible protein DinB
MTGQQTEKFTLGQTIAAELKHEAVSTRKMLERFPEGKADWSPHEKSMKMGALASHIADVPNWIPPTVTAEELDFSRTEYKPANFTTAAELVEHFDKSLAQALALLQTVSDEDLMKHWRLRDGEKIFFEMPRIQALRGMVLNHLIHHRGQYSVYLRLNDVPLPGVYGPSADEPTM